MGEQDHLSHLELEDVPLDPLEPETGNLTSQISKVLHKMVQSPLLPVQVQKQVNKGVRHPLIQIDLSSSWSPLLISHFMKLTRRP